VLEWVSTANQNTTIATAGRFNDGVEARFIPNNANTPTGDVNLMAYTLGPGDSYTFVISFLKQFQGQTLNYPVLSGNVYNYLGNVANVQNYGSGAWSSSQAGYTGYGQPY
jgi:hypothetical protein